MMRSATLILAMLALSACVDETDMGSFERSTGMKIDNPDAPRSHGHSSHHHSGHHHSRDEGTFRGATGEDPGTANLVRCSDGGLYPDCRNSPRGF